MANQPITIIVPDQPSAEVQQPPLTGNLLRDTLNSLLAERLELIRSGSSPNYQLHGHGLQIGEYVRQLDMRIDWAYKQLAQQFPLESVGVGV